MKRFLIALILGVTSCGRPEPGRPEANVPSTVAPVPRPESTLSLSIKVEGQAKVGATLPLHIRIRNVGSHEVDVIPPLDGSDVEFRYPYYTVRILGPNGWPAPGDNKGRCGYCNSFQRENLIRLRPEEAIDPLIEAPLGHWLSEWIPRLAGRHRLTLIVDFSAVEPAKWECHDYSHTPATLGRIRDLLARVPCQKLETTVEFDVAP